MSAAILRRELAVTLRRRRTFSSLFLFYLALVFATSLLWWLMARTSSEVLQRDYFARMIFFALLAMGFTFLCLHAALAASANLVREREQKTFEILATAPIGALSLVLQKGQSTLAVELIFLIGLLPFISLAFILGGLHPAELGYQAINLSIWILTSVLLGLRVSATATTVARAGARVLVTFVGATLVLPFTPLVLRGFHSFLDAFWSPTTALRVLLPAVDWMSRASDPLVALSPFWMIGSWEAAFGDLSGPVAFAGFWNLALSYSRTDYLAIFSDCPALLSWLMHCALQVLLLISTVHLLRRGKHGSPGERLALKSETPYGRLRAWLDSPPRRRRRFAALWIAHFQLEDREVFLKGWKTKAPLVLLFALPWLVFMLFLIPTGEKGLGRVTGGVSCFLGYTTALVLSGASFRRQRDRNTAVFLLLAPGTAWRLLLGRWLYYQTIGVVVFVTGFLASIGSDILSRGVLTLFGYGYWARYSTDGFFTVLWFTIGFLPLVTLVGLYCGLKGRSPLLIAGLFPVLFLGNAILRDVLYDLDRDLGYVYSIAVWLLFPIVVLGAAAISLNIGEKEVLRKSWWVILTRIGVMTVLFCIVLVDLANWRLETIAWGSVDYRTRTAYWLADAAILAHWTGIPACLAWLLWVWLASRKRGWWLSHLVPDHL
ncbi:MAG: hypothetical protein HUU16_13320 [Candidatus Omnitrophica bacterium]|nr:hypothetical protein [bacterium]NUN97143.1 hypothetical protein [Candidatus Omnitrophota bacterium]